MRGALPSNCLNNAYGGSIVADELHYRGANLGMVKHFYHIPPLKP